MKKSGRKTNIIITAALVLLLIAFESALILFSAFYQEIFNNPRPENGVMDFEEYGYHDAYVSGFIIQGEWEFFYNKWIITDETGGEPADAMISLPGIWTGLTVGEAKLPKTGYASYRITVRNIEGGDRIRVVTNNSPGAYRIFINGVLNTVSGRLSKNVSETFSSGRTNESYPYTVSEGEDLTVVIEASAVSDGGLFDPPALALSGGAANLYDRFYTIMSYMVTGIIFAYFIFSVILNFGLFRKRKQFSSSLLLFFVFAHFFTSKEAYNNFSQLLPFVNYAIIRQISFISGILVIAAFIYHLLRGKTISLSKVGGCVIGLLYFSVIALNYILSGTHLQIAAIILCFIATSVIFYLLSDAIRKKTKFSVINTAMLVFLTALIIAESLDNLGLLVFTMETPVSVILLLFVFCVTVMNFISIRDGAASALNAVVLEKENEQMKHKALRAQIKPHFIFNLLSSIQSLYKKDVDSGDEALTKFAAHLRQNIDADNNDLIPFEQELDNITNYVELENLRRSRKTALLLDIDFAEFEVPVLSLQPLVENAIKYAGTEEAEDGYIRITSARTDGDIIITVADNGRGFDFGAVRQNAAGLKNCEGRFKYLLNAEMTINSSPGEGTTVTVRLPAKENVI